MLQSHKLFVSILLVAFSFCAKAQDEASYVEEPLPTFYWGFVMGIEGGIFSGSETPSDTVLTKYDQTAALPGWGASVGVSAEFIMNKKWSFRPQAMLSILTTRIRYEQIGFKDETHMIYPMTADLVGHFVFNNPTQTKHLGAHFGPAVEFNLPVLDSPRQTSTVASLRADAGLSIPLNLGKGDFLLDVSYGYSLTDMISGETLLDQWWGNNGRHRLGVRLHIY